MHEVLYVARPPYLEMNTFGISLGARLLHVRDGLNCGHDETLDNAILLPNAFVSKSLSIVEWHYRNIEYEALGILNGLKKIPPVLFWEGSVYHH